jgi:hypothetical protein
VSLSLICKIYAIKIGAVAFADKWEDKGRASTPNLQLLSLHVLLLSDDSVLLHDSAHGLVLK